MKELLNILHRATALYDENQRIALATVVEIGGSTYRRPGARMLVTERGDRWGTISGGCLEGEVAQRALQVIETGIPELIPFDLSEDDIVLGFGTGCNGVVHILIQPLLPDAGHTVVKALQHCFEQRKTGILATIIATSESKTSESKTSGSKTSGSKTLENETSVLGDHLLLLDDGSLGPSTVEGKFFDSILDTCRQHLQQELHEAQMYLWHTSSFESDESDAQVLFEIVRPPVNLYIFGEGHDVQAVLDQASLMGWTTHIIGRKPIEVLSEKFPSAAHHKFLMHPENVLDLITPDNRSAALVMNHTYVRDRDVMEKLLSSSIPYIGMLGPRERTELMLTEIEEKQSLQSEDLKDKLFGPVGLDIGTETPEEIALSAVAEIQSVLHKREGASLRRRLSPIHDSRNPIERSIR